MKKDNCGIQPTLPSTYLTAKDAIAPDNPFYFRGELYTEIEYISCVIPKLPTLSGKSKKYLRGKLAEKFQNGMKILAGSAGSWILIHNSGTIFKFLKTLCFRMLESSLKIYR